jgi:glycosyltransferase involved in cell wall biosynthesis
LIADDASTDASAAVAQTLAAEDQRIHCIRLPQHGGKSHALNEMIERARGEWIAVLDANGQFYPHRLLNLISAAEACGSDLVVDHHAHFDDGLLKPVIRRSFIEAHDLRYCENYQLTEDFYYLLNFVNAGGRCCVVDEAQPTWPLPLTMQMRLWATTRASKWSQRQDIRDRTRASIAPEVSTS